MLTAILIADQQRLHALVAASLGGSGVQLTIISSLASGIEQAVATPPDLLFVQGRLSGLSAEIVSRHVATHVDQARTKLIIFVEPGEEPALARPQLHLDLALPDSALESMISALVKSAQPAAATGGDEFIPDPALAGQRPSHDATAPATASQESAGMSPLPSTESTVATRFEEELDTELARREEDLRPVKVQVHAEPELQRSGQPRVGQAEANELASKSRRRAVVIVAVVLLLAATIAVVQQMPASKTSAPGKPPATIPSAVPTRSKPAPASTKTVPLPPTTSPPPAPAAKAKPIEALRDPLPSFVPGDRRDVAYAAANPGWERYQDAGHEYKVFWENGKLKAVQVIDRSGSGLSPTFFTTAMKELAGVRDYQLVSREVKDNYLVKKGTMGKTGSIIIYKNKADSVLQAFVIHFDQGQDSRR
ncbi:hypothetical protein [Geobacter argillaceus]|uniref:Uncharacterized protein n=1 Tax=Geobacter argillaceus TaxID=345631 RepID=A0A562VM54_9BACT|nr:hypothetical protein [Geobacter argillaceus]TWJ18968.1 hypothetical protein JN12_02185 [Geobacter argillaceus]